MSRLVALAAASATVLTTSLAASLLMAAPAATPGRPPESAPAATTEPARPIPTQADRTGPRRTLRALPKAPRPTAPAAIQVRPSAKPAKPKAVVISEYRVCFKAPQPCIDAGGLTLYGNGAPILAGHDYNGYQWLSRMPRGRVIHVRSGPAAGTYRVYGHMRINRQSGPLPLFGRAALVFQTCEGRGTGFSLAERI